MKEFGKFKVGAFTRRTSFFNMTKALSRLSTFVNIRNKTKDKKQVSKNRLQNMQTPTKQL